MRHLFYFREWSFGWAARFPGDYKGDPRTGKWVYAELGELADRREGHYTGDIYFENEAAIFVRNLRRHDRGIDHITPRGIEKDPRYQDRLFLVFAGVLDQDSYFGTCEIVTDWMTADQYRKERKADKVKHAA